MYRLRWLICLIFVIVVAAGCGPKMVTVRSGARLTCPLCKRVVFDNVKTFKVTETEATIYRVFVKSEFCQNCKDEIIATVKAYMEAFNNQDVAKIYSLFSGKSQDIADQMAGASTGELYRETLRDPGCGESEKEYARQGLLLNYKFSIHESRFEVLPSTEFRTYSPTTDRLIMVGVKVFTDDKKRCFPLTKENGEWKILSIDSY